MARIGTVGVVSAPKTKKTTFSSTAVVGNLEQSSGKAIKVAGQKRSTGYGTNATDVVGPAKTATVLNTSPSNPTTSKPKAGGGGGGGGTAPLSTGLATGGGGRKRTAGGGAGGGGRLSTGAAKTGSSETDNLRQSWGWAGNFFGNSDNADNGGAGAATSFTGAGGTGTAAAAFTASKSKALSASENTRSTRRIGLKKQQAGQSRVY